MARAADPLDESLFLLERIPAKEAACFISLHNDRTLLEGSVGQEDIMIGAFHRKELLKTNVGGGGWCVVGCPFEDGWDWDFPS